jgi:hypothetical protein
VTVRENPHTGLAAPEVFYFANLVGETDGDLRVTAADYVAVRMNIAATSTTIANRYDFDRDGRVTAFDLLTVRANLSRGLAPFAAPPPPSPPSPPATLFGSVRIANATPAANLVERLAGDDDDALGL